MKITAFITPRQVGKTRHGIFQFLLDPENTVWVAENRDMIPRFIKHEYKSNTALVGNRQDVQNYFRSRRYRRAILDEYLFTDIKNRYVLNECLVLAQVEEVTILSTPKKLYDKFLFEYVCGLKKSSMDLDMEYALKNLQKNHTDKYPLAVRDEEQAKEEIEDLWHNLLTHPNCTIYDSERCAETGAFDYERQQTIPARAKGYHNMQDLHTSEYGKYIL